MIHTDRVRRHYVNFVEWERNFVTYRDGPFAAVRACRGCGHTEAVRKGLPGAGRGYGMREGNKARGRIIEHVKTCPKIAALIGVTP